MPDSAPRSLEVTLVGVNHRRAPLVLRECLAFPPSHLPPALVAMREYVPEGAILSTCHRVELYAAAPDAARARAQLQRFWSKHSGVPHWEFEPHLYHLEGSKAVEHLFSVASGLDSAIIGESQILGQVREALRLGLEQRSTGRVLSALFRQAVTTASVAAPPPSAPRRLSWPARPSGTCACRACCWSAPGRWGSWRRRTSWTKGWLALT